MRNRETSVGGLPVEHGRYCIDKMETNLLKLESPIAPFCKKMKKQEVSMKKFLSLLLALAMVFTLAACGGNNAPATDGNGQTLYRLF